MTENFQNSMFNYLIKNGIENFVGVPDSTLKFFIKEGILKKKILIATREEEAIGIATGMALCKSNSVIFMQNAGFANSLSTITSLIQLYKIPVIFLIGWRGFLQNDAPEHIKIGHIQQNLLKDIELENRVISEKTWKKSCKWALSKIKNHSSVALIIKRETVE